MRAWLICGIAGGHMLPLASCGSSNQTPTGDEPGFAIQVTPLSLQGVSDISYGVTVKNADGDTVWSLGGLTSDAYGDGQGRLNYIGPCDASTGANPNTVALTIESVTDLAGHVLVDGVDFENPAPPGDPVVVEAECLENGDTPVTFDLTIMRRAEQGFFDIGVTFDDIFCSAKVDCVDAETGGDIKLLHEPNGDRGTTVVMTLACTSGEGTPTYLHATDYAIMCGDEADGRTYWLNPSAGIGNTGGVPPIFFQTAIYQGAEELAPYDKCYWNMAFGVIEGPAAANCRLVASATASPDSWLARDGMTPDRSVYPYVRYNVVLTDANGQVACGQNPLNGPTSSVQTDYTDIAGARFHREMKCGEPPREVAAKTCAGTIAGSSIAFLDSPVGMSVAFGPSVGGPALPDCAYAPHDPSCRSPLYTLENDAFIDRCCVNACCGQL